MYVWKLWRDSRPHLLVCAFLGLAWIGLILYFRAFSGGATPATAWNGIAEDLHAPLIVVALLAALLLTEASLGSEFSKHTAEVLLTRPRRRRSFAWTGWLVAMAETVALMYVMVGVLMGVLGVASGTIPNWRLLASPILLLPSTALLFGFGFVVRILSNGRQGAVLTFGALVAYYSGVTLVTKYWHIQYPPRWWFDNLSSWATAVSPGSFPALPLLGWVLLALLFPLVAQWSLERRQI